jgi:hypothetical protein
MSAGEVISFPLPYVGVQILVSPLQIFPHIHARESETQEFIDRLQN